MECVVALPPVGEEKIGESDSPASRNGVHYLLKSGITLAEVEEC